jgi:hypothetical protein
MPNKRLIWFIIMIVIGLTGGLLYGWAVNPVQYIDTSAESLHPGYKADYVLMVAEIFKMDGDLPGAVHRLALLGPLPAERLVADGLLTARSAGYALPDIELMEALNQALQAAPDEPATAIPGAANPGTANPGAATPTSGGQP